MPEIEQEEWILSAKKALNWFIEIMGADEWVTRRKLVVDYFNSVSEHQYAEFNSKSKFWKHSETPYIPYAVYEDWIAWYMYLVESLIDRPTCDEPMQSSRVYPFFAAIGRRLDAAKQIDGIEDRMNELLNSRQNQPDSTLFELVIALMYCRNGWKVGFIKENPPMKTPDIIVSRADEKYLVECKRLAKVTDYSESERQHWLDRWKPLSQELENNWGQSKNYLLKIKGDGVNLPQFNGYF